MRLEGRGRGSTASTAQESMSRQRITRLPVSQRKCTVDYICPLDWCHAIGDVASASELRVAASCRARSVTMSGLGPFHLLLVNATASSVEHGVR
jgi:hypothetical protein